MNPFHWQIGRPTAVVVLVLAGAVFALLGWIRLQRDAPQLSPPSPPVRVPLFVEPTRVDHLSRLRFTFDSPEALADLRRDERLDAVVGGAADDSEAVRRLMSWAGAQWSLGIPNPYPPPDAQVILRDIRTGFTGGFCAQYCFVLLQATQSFGIPARLVTIERHEVVEAWLRDEARWVVLDPTYMLQVLDEAGRPLNALEIRRMHQAGRHMTLSDGHRLTETESSYLNRYGLIAVWIRNDFVSRPLNFTDFDRYRVWFDPADDVELPPDSLVTRYEVDLWPGIAGSSF